MMAVKVRCSGLVNYTSILISVDWCYLMHKHEMCVC